MLRLSVLDQSTVVTGRSPDTSIRESLALAKHCEALGYHRYWCAEHHNSESQAGTAPEILISAIAATTSRIRVGYRRGDAAALLFAQGGRAIPRAGGDRTWPHRPGAGAGAGLGRAHRLCAQSAGRDRGRPLSRPGARPAALDRGEKLVEGHPFRDIRAQPGGPTVPEVWILGSSDYGAQVAAYFGLPFCFAHFITDGRGVEQALAIYREGYRPSERHPHPARRHLRLGDGGGHPGRRGAAVQLPRDVAPGARSWGLTPPCPRRRKRRPTL